MGERVFVVNVASGPITPSTAGPLAGYAARGDAQSTGTHDDLRATIVWLRDGDGPGIVWLTLDAIGVTADLYEALRDAVHSGLEERPVVLACASHTHSGPLGWTGSIHEGHPGRRSETAIAELVNAARDLASTARASESEAVSLRLSTRPVAGVGTNRLSPDGPHDRSAGILTMRRKKDDTLVAMVLDYATHPTVLDAGNLQWSADWPGAARDVVSAAIEAADAFSGVASHRPAIAFLQGAAGDVSTRFTRHGQGFVEAARIGALLAGEVVVDLSGGGGALDGTIGVVTAEIVLPVRPLPEIATAEATVADAERALAATSGPVHAPAVRLAQTRLDGARVQLALVRAELPAEIVLPVEVVSIGDAAWVHVPLELFASLGARIQRASPFASTRVIGYSNGYRGYLADGVAHDSGSYEALSSYFSAEASEQFVAGVIKTVDAAYRRPTEE